MYSEIFGSSEEIVVDNTPLLTSFYSTVIDRVSFLAEEISDNYIYLSIFGIFILIFFIELIRRRF